MDSLETFDRFFRWTEKQKHLLIHHNRTFFCSDRKGAGNYQTWNLQYWNFYENFVVFQSKTQQSSTDINDENSVLLIGENQKTSEIRKFVG